MTFISKQRIRFGDIDHAQVVYYPNFFHYMHCAFEDFFDHQNMHYRTCLDQDRVGWPAVHTEADFKSPLVFGEDLEVHVNVIAITEKSATFTYLGYSRGKLSFSGKTVVACVDLNTFKAIVIAEKYRTLFEKHLEA